MFDLNRAVALWRQEMIASGVQSVEALDELETHLRDAFDDFARDGLEQQAAFKLAVKQVGNSADLAGEFQKIESDVWLPTKLATALLLISALGMFLWVSGRVRTGGIDLLLACHIFTVTVGYTGVLLTGGLWVCYISQRWGKDFPMRRIESLSRVTFMLNLCSAMLTIVGVALGAIWAKEHLGRYWGWDPKEIGGLAVISWLILGLAVRRLKVVSSAMILSIAGNVVVALAWFGTNLLASDVKSYGPASYLLVLFIAVNLIFCLIGLLPAGMLRPKRL